MSKWTEIGFWWAACLVSFWLLSLVSAAHAGGPPANAPQVVVTHADVSINGYSARAICVAGRTRCGYRPRSASLPVPRFGSGTG